MSRVPPCHVSRITHRLRHVCVLPVAAVCGHHGVPGHQHHVTLGLVITITISVRSFIDIIIGLLQVAASQLYAVTHSLAVEWRVDFLTQPRLITSKIRYLNYCIYFIFY